MYIDPITLNWLLIASASFCAEMIGYHFAKRNDETIIASTITYLTNEGYVKSYVDENGELELIKLHNEVPTNGTPPATDEDS